MASPDGQDAHTRHVGTAWRHQSDGISRRGEGVPDGTAGEAAALDLRHQTLAVWPETRRGSAEPGGCAAAALAEWGSTTGQQRWPGAEGGHRPALFSGYGHEAAASLLYSGHQAREEILNTPMINANVRIH